MYAKIDGTKVLNLIYNRPDWFNEDGISVSDEYLASENIYKVNDITKPEDYSEIKYEIKQNLLQNMTVNSSTKTVDNAWVINLRSSSEVFEIVCDIVDSKRNSLIYSDVEYSNIGFIQIRNEIDLRNIMSIGMDALKDVVRNNTNNIHTFLNRDNVASTLTPEEAVNIAEFVKARSQTIYNKSWEHKHVNLKAILNNSTISEEEKVNSLMNYDFNSNWE